jgi:hypothetical protein
MPNKKISAFNINTTPTGSDVLPIVNNGETKKIFLSGLTEYIGSNTNVKHWNTSVITINSDETIVISGDYVLDNTLLILSADTVNNITVGAMTFEKYGKLYIGGNLLLNNSNIINNGSINVAGAIILTSASTITGTGIII